ncbi:MAG: acyltransferase family protein [Actinomycetes bacterium]
MISRLPGLDGLRGIAVLAVIIYHADISALAGGFLGVDVFFVLSGFLITNLLLEELTRTNTIDRANFYLRRIRRLLPALLLVLIASVLVSGLFVMDAAYQVRRDLPWAITFVLNWSYLFFEQSYFVNISRPPLLQHLWSLSIEEQFYVIWPLLLIGLFKLPLGRITPRQKIFTVSLFLALASTAWMIYLSISNGFPLPNDPSRVYFGSDTHAMGLLIGCATAALWRSERLSRRLTPDRATAMNGIGWLSLAGIAYFFIFVGEFNEWLYRGGFLVLAIITAALIVIIAHPGLKFGARLGNPVLKWFGDRSYGIYLWHWPVFVLLRTGIDVQWPEPVIFIAKIALVLIISDFSYRLVELPIRKGAIGNRLAIWRESGLPRPATRSYFAVGLATAVFATSFVGMYRVPTPDAGNLTGIGGITSINEVAVIAAQPAVALSTDPVINAQEVAELQKKIQDQLPPVVFGDSVVLGARNSLREVLGEISIDAQVSRQPNAIAERIKLRQTENNLGQVVVIHMGTNGTMRKDVLRTTIEGLTDRKRVVVVNVRVPRSWMKPNNKIIAATVAEFPNVRFVDWAAASKGQKKYFAPDGVHLTKSGGKVFADLINEAIAAP